MSDDKTIQLIRQKLQEIKKLLDTFDDCSDDSDDTIWNLVWQDTFFDTKKWTPLLGDHRDSINTSNNFYTDSDGLVMTAQPANAAPNKLAYASYLLSYDSQKPQDFEKGSPTSFLIDFSKPHVKVEAEINLEKAGRTEDAWFAFWLMGPDTWNHKKNEPWVKNVPYMCQYDNDSSTGMEIDIMEYAPFKDPARDNGFNVACYIDQNSKNGSIRPDHNSYGYFEDINKHIDKPTDIFKGYHTYTVIKSPTNMAFFIDGQMYWEYTDPKFIPSGKNIGIRFSWEVQRGLWRGNNDPAIPNFKEIGKTVEARIKSVKVYEAE